MGETTTFSDLKAATVSEKIYLAEITPAQELLVWSATGGMSNTYQKSFLNESITLADDRTENIRKEIVKLTEDGVELTEQSSIATVEADAGSYWHDTANGIVYIHTSGSDDPVDYSLVGFFTLRFATKAITLRDENLLTEDEDIITTEGGIDIIVEMNIKFYEPYVSEQGIPAVRHRAKEIYWGSEVITSGSLVMINNDGYFDQISRTFIWSGKSVVLKLGGDNLSYGEYETTFTGTIQGKKFTRNEVSFNLRAKAFNLFQTIPLNKFTATTYTNLDPAVEGYPIPYYYGIYTATQAPIVTCINTAYAANQYQFKICDHAILSITQVYIDYGGGSGWQTIGHANENLANATFTITAAAFVIGTTKVKVAFSGIYSGAAVIEGAPEIVEHLLTSILPYDSGDLNTASFTNSKTKSDGALNVPIEVETTAMEVIEKVCASDIAFFDEDSSGDFRYRTWTPIRETSYDELTDSDFINTPEIEDDLEHLYWKVFIGYGYLCGDKKYLYKEEVSTDAEYLYERSDTYTLDTYLRGSADAVILAQRLLFLMGSPAAIIKGRTKLLLAGKLLGDQIVITLERAPFSGGYNQRVFEIFGLEKSCFPAFIDFEGRDVQDFGANAGIWAAATAPAWAAATDDEKNLSGFWLDANGFADPNDPDSKNISKWW